MNSPSIIIIAFAVAVCAGPATAGLRAPAELDFEEPPIPRTGSAPSGIVRDWLPGYEGIGYLFTYDPGGVVYTGSVDPISHQQLRSDALIVWGASAEFETEFVEVRDLADLELSLEVGATGAIPEIVSFVVTVLARDAAGVETEISWFEFMDAADGREYVDTLSVDLGTPLKFAVPTSAADPPTENPPGVHWTASGYDDSAWSLGSMGLGFDSGPSYLPFIGTDLSDAMRSRNGTVYARVPFDLSEHDLSQLDGFTLLVRDDDGFVAWVNGEQVDAHNNPGPLQWNSTATTNHPDSSVLAREAIELPIELLNPGSNLLALHGLNASISSADFLCDARIGLYRLTKPGLRFPLSKTQLDSDQIPDGTESIALHISAVLDDFDTAVFIDNFVVSGRPTAVGSYQSYMALTTEYVGEELEVTADPEADGIPNLIEYACGTEASQPDAEGAVEPAIAFDEAGFMLVEFKMRAGYTEGDAEGGYDVADLRYTPELAYDLERWQDGFGVPPFVQMGEIEDFGGGMVNVSLRSRRPLLHESDQAFFRLRVELVRPPQIIFEAPEDPPVLPTP